MSAVLESRMSPPASPPVSSAPDKPVSDKPALEMADPERRPRSQRLAEQGVKLGNGSSRARSVVLAVLPPLLGLALLVLVWQFIAAKNSAFPTPAVTLDEALRLFADPFY